MATKACSFAGEEQEERGSRFACDVHALRRLQLRI